MKAQSKIANITTSIHDSLNQIHALKAFFDSSTHVDRDEFKTFTKQLLMHTNALQALEWVPIVSHVNREEFIDKAKQEVETR